VKMIKRKLQNKIKKVSENIKHNERGIKNEIKLY